MCFPIFFLIFYEPFEFLHYPVARIATYFNETEFRTHDFKNKQMNTVNIFAANIESRTYLNCDYPPPKFSKIIF